MLRQEITRSVDRIGRAAIGAPWIVFRGQAVAWLDKMTDEKLREIMRTIGEESDRLRARFP